MIFKSCSIMAVVVILVIAGCGEQKALKNDGYVSITEMEYRELQYASQELQHYLWNDEARKFEVENVFGSIYFSVSADSCANIAGIVDSLYAMRDTVMYGVKTRHVEVNYDSNSHKFRITYRQQSTGRIEMKDESAVKIDTMVYSYYKVGVCDTVYLYQQILDSSGVTLENDYSRN